MADNSLINKYRPETFDEVLGHDAVVESLLDVLEKGSAHTFLFTGAPGLGKTTLARLCANWLGCTAPYEVDAASNTGIDDMRRVAEVMGLMPLGGEDVRCAIVDECHALSPQAVKSLLKTLEEPGNKAYWFLCTTEPGKMPETIRSRAATYNLKPVDLDVMVTLLEAVAEGENLPDAVTRDWLRLCARRANGSPRQALSNLAVVAAARSWDEALDLLDSAGEGSPEAFELARLLAKGADWQACQALLERLDKLSPETVRHTVRAYFTKVALGAKDERQLERALDVLAAFSAPFAASEGMSPLVLAVGRFCTR